MGNLKREDSALIPVCLRLTDPINLRNRALQGQCAGEPGNSGNDHRSAHDGVRITAFRNLDVMVIISLIRIRLGYLWATLVHDVFHRRVDKVAIR